MTTPKSPTLTLDQVKTELLKKLAGYMKNRNVRYYKDKLYTRGDSYEWDRNRKWAQWFYVCGLKVITLGLHPDITCRSLVTNPILTIKKVEKVRHSCEIIENAASSEEISAILIALGKANHKLEIEEQYLKVSRTKKQANMVGEKETFLQSNLQQTIEECEELVEKYKEQNSAPPAQPGVLFAPPAQPSAAQKTEEPVPVAVAVTIRQGQALAAVNLNP